MYQKAITNRILGTQYARKSYSQYGEDMILRAIFTRFPGTYRGCYIDVGAHHPKRFSNTYFFYQLGWQGLCVDPRPDIKEIFLRRRPRDIFINAGISDHDGHMTYYMYEEAALNTFSRELSVKYTEKGVNCIREVDIAVYKLSTVLDRYLSLESVVNFLSIDTEGFEYQVVTSNNFAKYRPQVIMLEVNDINELSDIDALDVHRFLLSCQYRPIAWTPNELYYVDLESQSYDGGVYLNELQVH
jgi:FkbM family methyltransferase